MKLDISAPFDLAENLWELRLSCQHRGCTWVHVDNSAAVAMNPFLARNNAVDAVRLHHERDHNDSWRKLAEDAVRLAQNFGAGTAAFYERAKRLGEVTR